MAQNDLNPSTVHNFNISDSSLVTRINDKESAVHTRELHTWTDRAGNVLETAGGTFLGYGGVRLVEAGLSKVFGSDKD